MNDTFSLIRSVFARVLAKNDIKLHWIDVHWQKTIFFLWRTATTHQSEKNKRISQLLLTQTIWIILNIEMRFIIIIGCWHRNLFTRRQCGKATMVCVGRISVITSFRSLFSSLTLIDGTLFGTTHTIKTPKWNFWISSPSGADRMEITWHIQTANLFPSHEFCMIIEICSPPLFVWACFG